MRETHTLAERLRAARLIPVLTVDGVEAALGAVRALRAGGLRCIEVTLRRPEALDAIRAIRAELPDVDVAAGTVLDAGQLRAAREAGCVFAVSPGLSATLLRAARDSDLPLLPGVATPSDILLGLEHGLDVFKLFPATALGGRDLLRALAGPFPQVCFCPTGGITPDSLAAFLAEPNVLACGGSWLAPPALQAAGDWAEVEARARAALSLTDGAAGGDK
jgi:2-dehydro-3-deoxyphosphogluconate aldolase/(4S)-4-hydroxy-2-oxoglutarate aldolase